MSAERKFLIDGIVQGIRVDGRELLDRRYTSVECGVLPGCFGSARVALVNSGTDVLAGVKAELLDAPEGGRVKQGSVEIHVSQWSAASSQGSRSTDAPLIASTVERCLVGSGGLPLDSLVEGDGAFYWVLHVDITVCADGGGLVDAAALAAFAALADTVLPGITTSATAADGDQEPGMEAVVDEAPSAGRKVDVSGVPLPVTLHAVAGRLVVDATDVEEACADAAVTVAVTPAGRVAAITSTSAPGKPCLTPTLVDAALRSAVAIAEASAPLRSAALASASSLPTADGTGSFDPTSMGGTASAEGLPSDAVAAAKAALGADAVAKGHLSPK